MNMDNLDQATLDPNLQQSAPPKQRGWWSRNWLWFVPTLLLVLIVAGGGGVYWLLFVRVYNLKECRSAMQAIQADNNVQASLGQPIQPIYWPSQEAAPSAQTDQSRIDIRWSIEGPKGRAKAHTLVEQRQGQWQTVIVEVILTDGKKISIGSDAGGDVAPPFLGPKTEPQKPDDNGPPPEINLPMPDAAGRKVKVGPSVGIWRISVASPRAGSQCPDSLPLQVAIDLGFVVEIEKHFATIGTDIVFDTWNSHGLSMNGRRKRPPFLLDFSTLASDAVGDCVSHKNSTLRKLECRIPRRH